MLASTSRALSRSSRHLRSLQTLNQSNPILRSERFRNGPITQHFHSTAYRHSDSLLSRFSQRALYRKDGTPRSKIKGLIYGTLSVGFLVVSMAVADLMTDMEDMILLLAAILQVQVIDSSEFSSMDFDSYKTTVSYFHKICKPMLVTPGYALPEAVDTFFEDLRDLDYAEVSGEDTRDKMHGVMRDAAKEVHELLFKSREEPALAAQELIKVIRKALEMVILELQAHFDQGLSEWLKALKENEGDKAATLKERGYDIIG